MFTSNVDGQFQRAGFPEESVYECHGSIHYLQCAGPCGDAIWPADGTRVVVDEQTMRAEGDLPRCGRCGGLARPNVLMFGDGQWSEARAARQAARYRGWLKRARGAKLAVIECGAGTAVPTVRLESERAANRPGATLVRINLREPAVPASRHVPLSLGAAEALKAINAFL